MAAGLSLLAPAARSFKFIARLPADGTRLVGSLPAEGEPEARHGGVGRVVQARMVLIARLVVVMGGVVGVLIEAPGLIVALEFHPLIDGKRRDADACEAEVIGAVVMAGFGARIGTNLK